MCACVCVRVCVMLGVLCWVGMGFGERQTKISFLVLPLNPVEHVFNFSESLVSGGNLTYFTRCFDIFKKSSPLSI